VERKSGAAVGCSDLLSGMVNVCSIQNP
jgi:hypothetical protein